MNIFEYKRAKKSGFTLVEVMLLLVVVSLIVASSTAVITRKHKLKPRKTVHGQYICFYDLSRDPVTGNIVDRGKREILVSNGTILDDRYVPENQRCTFTIPRTATYLHVRMLGGGGAGGNANYVPDEANYLESKSINIVRGFSGSASNYYTAAKLHDGNSANDNDSSWSNSGNLVAMGVPESYVDNKFKIKVTDNAGNVTEVPLFHSSLFKKFLNESIIDGIFAYDYAGNGHTGGSLVVSAFNTNRICSSEEGASNTQSSCYNVFIKDGRTLDNQYESCVTADGDPKYCPEFFKDFYKPGIIDSSVKFFGGDGGKGAVFASNNLSNFDFNMYPVVGWRWQNYNSAYTADRSNSIGIDASLCNRPKSDYVIDWLTCYSHADEYRVPQYKDSAVKAGVLKPCGDDTTKCRASKDGTLHLLTEDYKLKVVDASGNYDTSKNGFEWATDPSFDGTEWYVTDNSGEDLAAATPKKPILPFVTDTMPDGGFPYFDGDKSKSGVKLRSGSRISGHEIGNAGGKISGTVANAAGKAGESLSGSGSKAIGRLDVWNVDGTARSALPVSKQPSAGTNGQTSFTNFNGACISNLGFVFKNPSIAYVLHISGSTSDAGTALGCVAEKEASNYTPHIARSIVEGEWALQLKLRYYSKAISYGEAGKAGGYNEFFTRTYRSNDIFVEPGKGGIARRVGESPETQPGSDQNGKGTLLFYNCTTPNSCASKSVGGGRGGVSGIKEAAENLKMTGKQIREFLNSSNKKRIHCSYLAPSTAATEYGCDNPSASVGDGDVSKFAEVAPLLDLPSVGPNLDLTQLGRGGKAGYAVDNCWVMPQYFAIDRGSYIGSLPSLSGKDYVVTDVGSSASILDNLGDITGDGNWYGNTYLPKSAVDACRANNTFSDGNYYKEVQGTDGMPGAVVITW